jgi:hypothetical protein
MTKTPTIRELYSVVRAVKQQIDPDCRAYEEDEVPGMLLTVGIADDNSWDYQVGCNQYHGSAYFYPYWVVTSVHRDSNCRDIARYIKEEWAQLPSPLGQAARDAAI